MSKSTINFAALWQRHSIYGSLLRLYLFTVLIALVGALSIYRNNVQLSYQAEEIITYRQFVNTRSLYLVKDINQANAFAYEYLATNNLLSLQKMQYIVEETLPKDLDSLRNVIANGEDQSLINQTASLRKDITQWQNQWEKVLKRYRADKVDRREDAQKQVNLLSDKIRKQLVNISAGQETLIKNALLDIQQSTDTLFFAIIYFSIVLIVAGFVLGYVTLRRLIKQVRHSVQYLMSIQEGELPEYKTSNTIELQTLNIAIQKLSLSLTRLRQLAEEVGSGNFDTHIRVFGGKGELGKAVSGMRESLERIAEENRQRNWTNEGLTQLGDVLRRYGSNPDELYAAVIRNLVEYLEISQGAIFAIEYRNKAVPKSQDKMRLMAGFAYRRQKQIDQQFGWGEGLIGQAWRERDTLIITDIPDDFPDITIGIGEARPRTIIISPLITNNEVYGIIEFAAFKEIPPYRLEFIKQVGESIATTIARLKADRQTQKLLEDSQAMAERLSSQEEQMRQNLSELVETQEKMQQSTAELEGQLKALSTSFIMMEFDLNGKIIEVTDTLLDISGYEKEDLLGKHFSILLGYRHKQEQITQDWEQIKSGNYIQGEFLRYTKQGKPFWLFEVVYPTLDARGNVSKIYSIAYDITTQKQQEEKIKEQLKELQMSKRDVVKRIREVEKKERSKLEKLKEEFQKKLQEKDNIINELKN